ncbi:DUF1992 domain-containing protein [Demequina gelatinilytica]|uniref:DnaJ family domain-containing protein n=1 Tax=Demequina gelatinilytica TaxID=1638980 RepID=UPI000783B995|nr:DUF1992 domain-containing protein [Demequina gelatinilytica]
MRGASDRDPAAAASRYRIGRDAAQDARETDDAPEADLDVAALSAREERRVRAQEREARLRRDRAATQHLWVERRLEEAFARGDFDDLPLAGRPIPGLGTHDPDWWVKGLVEREHLTDLGPESVRLREEDASLDARLDALTTANEVREAVEDFNARILAARCRPAAGPPLVTPTRDVAAEVERWRARRPGRIG